MDELAAVCAMAGEPATDAAVAASEAANTATGAATQTPEVALPFDPLSLDNQLCFPLYACAKEIVRRYGPLLDDLDLTYTQYLCMMALWEHDDISVSELGARLHLDSGTLTPLLKRLEQVGYVVRARSTEDERRLRVRLTDEGRSLRERALCVPGQMVCKVPLSAEEGAQLAEMLRTLLSRLAEHE